MKFAVTAVLTLFLIVVSFSASAQLTQPPPNNTALDEALKARAAMATLRTQLQAILDSEDGLDEATKKEIAVALDSLDTTSTELSRVVYEIVRSFRGDRVLGALSWGVGGERTWKLPFMKKIGAGLGAEISTGLALVFLRNQPLSFENPEVAGYYSYGPHLATGFFKSSSALLKNRGGRQMFPILRLYFVPSNQEVSISHSGDLSRWYAGLALEIPWQIILPGTFQVQLYGSWGVPREQTTDELRRRVIPEVIMAAIAPGLGSQDSGFSLQLEGQYVQFVGLRNK